MGLLIGVGDFGIGDMIERAQHLYDLLADLCNGQLQFSDILNKPDTLVGYGITDAYTKDQILTLLEGKADAGLEYSYNDLLDLPTNIAASGILDVYTKDEVDSLISDLAIGEHQHDIADITGLQDALTALKFKLVSSIPTTPAKGSVYCVYASGKFSLYVTDDDEPANVIPMDAVSATALATALASKQNKLTGLETQYVKGDGTYGTFNKASIGLGNVDNTSDTNKPLSDATAAALTGKANDADVLKKTGNQTKTSGVLTFIVSPEVPEPVSSLDAANKGYVDSLFDQSSGQLTYLFDTPAEEWIITHNLNKQPDPIIIVGGKKVLSDVEYIDNDILKVIHAKPQVGAVKIDR